MIEFPRTLDDYLEQGDLDERQLIQLAQALRLTRIAYPDSTGWFRGKRGLDGRAILEGDEERTWVARWKRERQEVGSRTEAEILVLEKCVPSRNIQAEVDKILSL